MSDCMLCDGSRLLEYADVFRQPDDECYVGWEISGVIACSCSYSNLVRVIR